MIEIKSSHLLLPLDKWNEFIKVNRGKLSDEDTEWLNRWEEVDLALSPIFDEQRRYLRNGHYLGWIDAKGNQLF